ncbi:MAG: LysR family transcriptional regulator [Planctomycetota bacterium]
MDRLNFHHLHYFWAVAKEGNLTRTAQKLHVSQSALSTQIRQLERQLALELFRREGRRLVLTEAGELVLSYADEIFATGSELLATVERGRDSAKTIRIGTVATLSRNFQESFVSPLLGSPEVRLALRSGSFVDLLERLVAHEVDLVLSNRAPSGEKQGALRCRRVATQPVSLIGHARRQTFSFPDDLEGALLVVPGPESTVRTEFDALCEQLGIRPEIHAEVDDMATMRLLARDVEAIALLPSVVVRDELRAQTLHEYCVVPDLVESFFAVTVDRQFPHPLLRSLLSRTEEEILAGR